MKRRKRGGAKMSDKQNTGLHQVRRLPRTIVSKSQYKLKTIMLTSSTASGQQYLVCKKKSKLLYKRNMKLVGLIKATND